MIDPDPAPLQGMPEREAVNALRGYSYQMLRSIESWLDLRDGEVLALEGAEDLDRIGETEATVEQVKDNAASGNITLRSETVLDAISNFWGHLGRNAQTTLKFRYLTTANTGREQGNPFGIGDAGITIWGRIQADPAHATSLRDADAVRAFFHNHPKLSADLRAWLGSATPAQFISRIVLPFEFVTGWPDWTALKATVEAKLIELCDGRGIGSADALTALDALHSEVWRIATSKRARLLRRGDLLRIVDAAGTTAIPNAQLFQIMQALSGGATTTTSVEAVSIGLTSPPRAAPRRHARPDIESAIRDAIASGTVLLHGATGMGKTGLALATISASRLTAWVDLRDLPPAAVAAQIAAVCAALESQGVAQNVVVDDLPIAGDGRAAEGALGRVRAVQDRLGGSLLVTAADRLPPRMAAQLSLDMSRAFAVPAFSQDDVQAYLVANGCPADRADDWAKVISASTSGHPQLVDARVLALSEAGFPKVTIAEFLVTPPEIIDARAEAQRIVSARPADDRELLARASLLLGRVPRDRLIAVARIAPAIAEPGNVIDRLTGPWLERTDSDELRVSPLLRNLGTDAHGQEWAVPIHRGIAWTVLKGRSLLASDVFELATHAMLGRSARSIVAILPSLLQASAEVWEQVAETASMLTYIAVGESMASPFLTDVDTAAFRVLQLRIAIETGEQDRIDAVLGQALREFDAPSGNRNLGTDLFEIVLLWQIMQSPGEMPLERRLTLALRFARAGRRIAATTAEGVMLPDGSKAEELSWPDLSVFMPMALMPVVTDVDSLELLLDLIDQLAPEDRAIALGSFAGDGEAAALALDRVWLGEANRVDPRWPELAATLERTIDAAQVLGISHLVSAAAPLLVRVTDENLRDPEAALALADRLIRDFGRPMRVLAAKGRVLMRSSREGEALPLYDEALAAFPLGLSWKTDALRDAAVTAGNAEEWSLAAARLAEALTGLDVTELPVRRIGLLFDFAIALHLAGRTREAVDALGEATDLLVEDGRALPPEPLVSVRQLGSQVVKTITGHLKPGTMAGDDPMELPRVFGLPSAMHELTWGDQTPANLDLFVFIMAELDILMLEPPAIAARLAPRMREASDLLAQAGQGDLLTRIAIRTLDVDDGVADAVKEARALSFAAHERDEGREVIGRTLSEAPDLPPASMQEFVKFRLIARILPLLARNQLSDVPIERWLADLPAGETLSEVRLMLEDFGRLASRAEKAAPRIRSGNPTWDTHLIVVLLAPFQGPVSVEDLLVCHAVAARYLKQPKLGDLTDEAFSTMVTGAWLERCDHPAQLVSPRLSTPAIRQAATTTSPGWPRVTAVLRAASGAVSSHAAASVRENLRTLDA